MAEMLRGCEDKRQQIFLIQELVGGEEWGEGELILLIKEGEHFEAVIKDEVICTNAQKNFAFTLFVWKHLAKTC